MKHEDHPLESSDGEDSNTTSLHQDPITGFWSLEDAASETKEEVTASPSDPESPSSEVTNSQSRTD